MSGLYNLLLHLALPFALLRLWWRGRREPGYRAFVGERLGRYRARNNLRPTLWLHAVSLGETRAAAPLVEALLQDFPEHRIVLTHMTPTGRAAGADLFARPIELGLLEQAWLPYDLPWAVRRFYQHFKPEKGLLMETEVWPNLVRMGKSYGCAVALVNARMSERSAARYGKFAASKQIFSQFALVLAQSLDDARRIKRLGAPNVLISGNLKFDVQPNAVLVQRGEQLRAALGERRVWCAASTRDGEEEIILRAWFKLRQQVQELGRPVPFLWLVPRHPQRFAAVRELLATFAKDHQLRTVQRSGTALLSQDAAWLARLQHADVGLGDSMGEMPMYYAASDAVLIGGSIKPLGGQNLIEACALGKPVLMGQHMFNFSQASEDAERAGAAIRVLDEVELTQRMWDWTHSVALRNAASEAALGFAKQHRGATVRTALALQQLSAPA